MADLASEIVGIEGVLPNRAATAEDIRAAELRLGITIPAELRDLVMEMDGCDGETPPERGWTRFWRLRKWRRVADLGFTTDFSNAIVFADYCQESWWWAFEAGSPAQVRVAKIAGPDCIVSTSLGEFLDALLRDDPRIYGT